MTAHIFLPGMRLRPIPLTPEQQNYLREWRTAALSCADDDDVCASMCLQAAFIELSTDDRLTTDWLGIFDACLTDANGCPIAYSAKYATRVYGFGNQAVQSTIVAAHTRWWLESLRAAAVDHARYGQWLLRQKYRDGLIYDYDVSETILRHRMRTELTMSLAYALEILRTAGLVDAALRHDVLASLADVRRYPPSRYMSAEYFRRRALEELGAINHFPVGVEDAIEACATGLAVGFGDFAMADKRDSYMGTAKRTGRDKPIHSPLSACHVIALLPFVQDAKAKARIEARLAAYTEHLRAHPLDIPAFQMRDVHVPFGADKTPIEVLCAAHLMAGEVHP